MKLDRWVILSLGTVEPNVANGTRLLLLLTMSEDNSLNVTEARSEYRRRRTGRAHFTVNCGNTRCLARVSKATPRGVKRPRVFPRCSLDLDGLNKILFIVLRFFGFPFTQLFHLIFSNLHVFEGSKEKAVDGPESVSSWLPQTLSSK